MKGSRSNALWEHDKAMWLDDDDEEEGAPQPEPLSLASFADASQLSRIGRPTPSSIAAAAQEAVTLEPAEALALLTARGFTLDEVAAWIMATTDDESGGRVTVGEQLQQPEQLDACLRLLALAG